MMTCTAYCRKCRKYKPDDNYGLKTHGREYLTCMTCRKNQPPASTTTPSSSTTSSASVEVVIALNRGIAEREENIVGKRGFLNHNPDATPKPPIPVGVDTCEYEFICLTLKKYGIHIYIHERRCLY